MQRNKSESPPKSYQFFLGIYMNPPQKFSKIFL